MVPLQPQWLVLRYRFLQHNRRPYQWYQPRIVGRDVSLCLFLSIVDLAGLVSYDTSEIHVNAFGSIRWPQTDFVSTPARSTNPSISGSTTTSFSTSLTPTSTLQTQNKVTATPPPKEGSLSTGEKVVIGVAVAPGSVLLATLPFYVFRR